MARAAPVEAAVPPPVSLPDPLPWALLAAALRRLQPPALPALGQQSRLALAHRGPHQAAPARRALRWEAAAAPSASARSRSCPSAWREHLGIRPRHSDRAAIPSSA